MSDGLKIKFVGDNDSAYMSDRDENFRNVMVQEGRIRLETCFNSALIPLSYLLKLYTATYSGTEEPISATAAVHHWLLMEFCNAIGGHTIL